MFFNAIVLFFLHFLCCVFSELIAVDGGWSEWSSWTTCPKACDVGRNTRYRYCNQPVARHGGKDCKGFWKDSHACNTEPCPGKLSSNLRINFSAEGVSLLHKFGRLFDRPTWTNDDIENEMDWELWKYFFCYQLLTEVGSVTSWSLLTMFALRKVYCVFSNCHTWDWMSLKLLIKRTWTLAWPIYVVQSCVGP